MMLSKKVSKWTTNNILTTLMSQMQNSFVGLLTSSEFRRLVIETFLAAPPQCSLVAVLNNIRCAENCDIQRVFELLDAVEEHSLRTLVEESFSRRPDDSEWCAFLDEIGRLLWQFQDRIYNTMASTPHDPLLRLKDDVHSVFLAAHWKRILKTVKNAVTVAKERIENCLDTNMQFVATLIPPLFRSSPENFDGLILWLGANEDSPIWERLNSRLLSEAILNGFLPGRSALVQIVLAATDGAMLKRLLGNEILRDPMKKLLFEDMLINKVFGVEKNVPLKLVQCLNTGSQDFSSTQGERARVKLHIETAIRLLKVWSQKSHLLHSSDEQLTYMDCAVLCFVKYASDEVRKGMKWLAEEPLINGTQRHLECSDPRRKIRGLFIAEKLSEWLSFRGLQFDRNAEMERELIDLRAIVNGDLEQLPKPVSMDDPEEHREVAQEMSAELTSLPTRERVELDSDDDDFPEYSIPDEELHPKESADEDAVEKREPPPHYIRDCMEALYESENYAKFEAAFGVLNQFIRKRALGYDGIAEELIMKLVFLEDRFSTKNFEEQRCEMLVSCMVMSPHLAPMLIGLMYSRRCSMCNRYLILNVLSEAATELSSRAGREVEKSVKTIMEKPKEGPKNWREIIDERVEMKTRRFGRGKTNADLPAPQKNRFAEFASSFLRPLLAINQHREHLNLKKEDSALLAKIIGTAGHILQCAQNCPCSPRLATWLEICVRELRTHEDSSVRLSVLFCYESICHALPNEVYFELFAESVPEWLAYASFETKNDPSAVCRELAARVQYLIVSKAPLPFHNSA
ncbi:unnamed protein product [Toxocara canis]|uniref:Telomere_reg-2 domain-containing protein n=1 Tax=Toxocara canis TaxID=6265 RepID=A0A183V083_TOXCA|nr:unnamed protein product [Toxocara canis]